MPPCPPLKGALIGCGFVSRHHLDAWRGIPEAAIVALCASIAILVTYSTRSDWISSSSAPARAPIPRS
jgi:hypothetical protein